LFHFLGSHIWQMPAKQQPNGAVPGQKRFVLAFWQTLPSHPLQLSGTLHIAYKPAMLL